MAAEPLIQTRSLSFRYGETLALDGVNLEVPSGFFALLGPNGAGKSTLVGILATLLAPQAGEAFVMGHSVRQQPRQVRKRLGLVFQEPSLDERLTVHENLAFHALIYGMGLRHGTRIREVLELVELSEWAQAPVRALSRGMKRRLEIGRAILHRPRLLVLDEPTTGLDVQSRRRIWDYLRALQAEGVSLLLTTHQLEEAQEADRVAILDRGRLLEEGSPDELRRRHGVARVVLELSHAELAERLAREQGGQREGLRLTLEIEEPQAFLAQFMPNYGGAVRHLEVRYPSLEAVFLKLTGRALRDEGAGDREALSAYAARGGEHTR
ncbi:ABC transporter ATP-binding protein [Meiothermus sp. CFH 77666]|uniref:ABC transporter ATP-binding protein n=1 Tax=Meiothermus sp. CFH 77666 TaxID=2817942 RepID=UPI001AA0902C|nr:ABC transporter ATP-binding protein [Meiothermus sp. CFH 77666]MBO1436572.1 ABC transporter ATP-binding protein [Meiothermus sp. CFH 77666]